MNPKARVTIGGKTDTRVMYIGSDRFAALSDAAIDVSYKGKRQITASQVAQYVIDNYLEVAMDRLIKEIHDS